MKKAQSLHHQTQGAAASAAKYRGNGGVRDRSGKYCFIPGEGWVLWTELQRTTAAAYDYFVQKKALLGHYLYDPQMRLAAHIAEARAKKRHGATGNHFSDAHPLR